MRKVIISVGILAVTGLASCKKCIECTYEAGGQKVSSGPICGKRSEIEDAKKTWESTGKSYGVTTTCVDQ